MDKKELRQHIVRIGLAKIGWNILGSINMYTILNGAVQGNGLLALFGGIFLLWSLTKKVRCDFEYRLLKEYKKYEND